LERGQSWSPRIGILFRYTRLFRSPVWRTNSLFIKESFWKSMLEFSFASFLLIGQNIYIQVLTIVIAQYCGTIHAIGLNSIFQIMFTKANWLCHWKQLRSIRIQIWQFRNYSIGLISTHIDFFYRITANHAMGLTPVSSDFDRNNLNFHRVSSFRGCYVTCRCLSALCGESRNIQIVKTSCNHIIITFR
jgi:hypothetical protein